MKKFLSLALALVMTASLLAGCGGSSSGGSTSGGSSASSGAAASQPSGGGSVSLNFSTGGTQGTYYGFGNVLAQ